jgi:23S rRNA pseudouridine1911/1915/1917 synthase
MQPEEIPLDIIYEDGSIIVVNKLAGMLVHPTHRDKNGTLLNALVFYLNKEQFEKTDASPENNLVRPGLVHRLDKETSGLMVIAKSVNIHRKLAREFMKKRVEKRYIALVEGTFRDSEGTIESSIGRFAERKMWDIKEDGKMSVTRYKIIDRSNGRTLLQLEPVTGRTNQLRIHCASVGHPIIGDVQRGGPEFERLCLHASELKFKHPTTNESIAFATPVPSEFQF